MNTDELMEFTVAKFFLDTNVLVYSFDQSVPEKQQLATHLIETALQNEQGTISSQVIQEFLSLAGRKFASPLNLRAQRLYLSTVLRPLCHHYPSEGFYERALDTADLTGFSLYDSLIVTAAIDCNCAYLFSEDMQHGRNIQGLTILNPFAA